jgi:uncharacterized protein (TIGR02145 family)
MAENLNFKTENSYCVNDNDTLCLKYGRLYAWSAAMDSAGAFSTNGLNCGNGKKCTADSIDRDPPGSRHVSGLTLGISQEGYERIVERINAFRKEIALIAEEDASADKVFQLQFALFPVGGKNDDSGK